MVTMMVSTMSKGLTRRAWGGRWGSVWKGSAAPNTVPSPGVRGRLVAQKTGGLCPRGDHRRDGHGTASAAMPNVCSFDRFVRIGCE
jgi:hypothetical protein